AFGCQAGGLGLLFCLQARGFYFAFYGSSVNLAQLVERFVLGELGLPLELFEGGVDSGTVDVCDHLLNLSR
ncbi:MAG TPA: hypothetical protein DC084_26310, partial [Cupriavidus sp.]|nr:hypothetical protein [Cupriavidus sp.]